jgi:hypothetical protein
MAAVGSHQDGQGDPERLETLYAMVSMMLPSVPVELLGALELELESPLRSAIAPSMKEEMIDCADAALVEDVVPDELDVLPESAPIRL